MGIQVTQLPEEVVLRFIRGNDVSFRVDIDMPIEGYTFESRVTREGAPLVDMSVVISGTTPSGILYLGLTGEQTALIDGSDRWYCDWISDQNRRLTIMRGPVMGEEK